MRHYSRQPKPPKLVNTNRWRVEQSHAHRHLSSRRTVVYYEKTLISFAAFVSLAYVWRMLIMLG